MECTEFRTLAGGDPRHLEPEAEEHRASCPHCDEFLRQALAMDAVIRRALEVPVPRSRGTLEFPAAARAALSNRSRWLALAASIVGGVLVRITDPDNFGSHPREFQGPVPLHERDHDHDHEDSDQHRRMTDDHRHQ